MTDLLAVAERLEEAARDSEVFADALEQCGDTDLSGPERDAAADRRLAASILRRVHEAREATFPDALCLCTDTGVRSVDEDGLRGRGGWCPRHEADGCLAWFVQLATLATEGEE